ncbi:MAG: sugar porter family MFS transporter [Methanobrevibacter sp.]|jgi:sugar porter (SP) family MFS transporter|nr:sugar porter family MFS transporter [Candidatus Methanoflexus mossambicus]
MKFNINFIFFFGALGGFLFGFDSGIISGASPLIESTLYLSVEKISFITSSVLIGSAIGALSIGFISDKYGRKVTLIGIAVIFIIGSLVSSIAPDFISLIFARILLGFAIGGVSSLTPTYLAEIAPAKKRGQFGSMFQLMITFGILTAYLANLFLLNHHILGINDWRWMLLSSVIPGVLLFIGSLFIPESPRYLIAKGKIAEGKSILNFFREGEKNSDVENEFEEIKKIAILPKGSFKDLFKIAKPSLIVAIGIMFLSQLMGINSIIYYCPQIFIKGFNFPEYNAIIISIGIGFINFLVTIIALYIMDKFNRKSILTFGSITMLISLLALTILDYTFPIETVATVSIILIAIYIFGFAISWGPISWLIISEIFPLQQRTKGTAIGSLANWIGNWIVTQFFLVLLIGFNNHIGGPFAIFAIFAFISIFFVRYMVPETKGKSLEEIEEELRFNS